MRSEGNTRVALCVITYLRPVGLRRLLDGIDALEADGLAIEVLIVDNDPDGSARPVIARYETSGRWPCRSAIEPQRGIPSARNRAVALALETDADLVGFIDDDEVPRPGWARALVDAWEKGGYDVVIGPSIGTFVGHTPPSWITDGGFFDRDHGAARDLPVGLLRTSGVMIARSAFTRTDAPWFDDRLALSGGSDRVFFARLRRTGTNPTFRWVPGAIVDEYVPASRARAAWLLRRSFRHGITRSYAQIAGDRATRRERLDLGRRALRQIVRGCVRTITSIPAGRAASFDAVSGIAYGIGIIAGQLGLSHHEYRRIHGV